MQLTARLRIRFGLLLVLLTPLLGQAQIVSDRPDAAEGSAVVGKGVFQIEAGFATERERGAERSRSTPTLFRFGVSDDFELRLGTECWTSAGKDRGMGDSSIGAKWQVLDDKKGDVAMALVAEVALPTGARAFRGEGSRPSLMLATDWELGKEWSLSIMPGLARDRDDNGKTYSAGVLAVSLDHEWTEQLHSFIELSAPRLTSTQHGGNQFTINVGGAFNLSKDWQVDAALFHGLNKNTHNNFFTVGFSTRF